MEVCRVTSEEYKSLVPDRLVFFNEPDFCELNRAKADDVHYLVIKKENSARFGVILGQVGESMRCPFSAPYSFPVAIRSHTRVAEYDEALDALETYCKEAGMKRIRFVFPPLFYGEHDLSAWISAFYRKGYGVSNLDINYSMDLTAISEENYLESLDKKSRKHLKKALQSGLEFVVCETEEDRREAYDIVKMNHDMKRRPTHMSFEDLVHTFSLVPHGVFLARLEGKGIAAMIYYGVRPEIVECIYSGYFLEYSNFGVMNFLSYKTAMYFKAKGYQLLDRATATESSIPNYGLCDFKESVGCTRSLKYTFEKSLEE